MPDHVRRHTGGAGVGDETEEIGETGKAGEAGDSEAGWRRRDPGLLDRDGLGKFGTACEPASQQPPAPSVLSSGGSRRSRSSSSSSSSSNSGGGGGGVLRVAPQQGLGVFFYSMRAQGGTAVDPMSWHGSCPVRSGVKWVAQFWIRDRYADVTADRALLALWLMDAWAAKGGGSSSSAAERRGRQEHDGGMAPGHGTDSAGNTIVRAVIGIGGTVWDTYNNTTRSDAAAGYSMAPTMLLRGGEDKLRRNDDGPRAGNGYYSCSSEPIWEMPATTAARRAENATAAAAATLAEDSMLRLVQPRWHQLRCGGGTSGHLFGTMQQQELGGDRAKSTIIRLFGAVTPPGDPAAVSALVSLLGRAPRPLGPQAILRSESTSAGAGGQAGLGPGSGASTITTELTARLPLASSTMPATAGNKLPSEVFFSPASWPKHLTGRSLTLAVWFTLAEKEQGEASEKEGKAPDTGLYDTVLALGSGEDERCCRFASDPKHYSPLYGNTSHHLPASSSSSSPSCFCAFSAGLGPDFSPSWWAHGMERPIGPKQPVKLGPGSRIMMAVTMEDEEGLPETASRPPRAHRLAVHLYDPKHNVFVSISGHGTALRAPSVSPLDYDQLMSEARIYVGGMRDAVVHSVVVLRRALQFEELKALANDHGIEQ